MFMSKPLPEHVTRTEAAAVLRLSHRQVDRLARVGALKKTKLSASRSGFAREELERYLQDLNAAKKNDSADGAYASQLTLLVVDIPNDIPHDINRLAERLDALLCRRMPGCWLKVRGKQFYIMWNAALGYTPDAVLNVV
jgi:hypothetical protein